MRFLVSVLAILVLSGSAFAASNVLTWTDNSNNETAFDIERKVEACGASTAAWSVIGTVGPGIVTYTDTGLAEGASYCYRVNSRNVTAKSGYSNLAGDTIPFSTPAAPSLLDVTPAQ